MACGTQFAHMESFQPTEKSSREAVSPPCFSEDDIGQDFHQAARALMPYILIEPSLRGVQACLMMATYNFSIDSAGVSYIYLSLAVSLAVQQGMHHQRYIESSHNTTAEVRKRIWWTVYILHLQASIKYGRPKFLSVSDINVEKPTDVAELRPSKEISSFANQVGLIELTLTAQTISDEIASLRKTNHSVHVLNLLSIREKLIKWRENIPEIHQTWGLEINTRRLRNDIHLRLYYWNTRLALGRPFLLLAPTTEAPNGASETRHFPRRESLVQDSIDGALEIISLCHMLRGSVGLARASYVTEFTSCRTAMLVLLAQCIVRRTPKVQEALSRGLEIIKVMSFGSSLARSEARVIEVLQRAVIHLEGVTEQGRQDAHDPKIHDRSDYDAFKTWSRLWKSYSGLTQTRPFIPPEDNSVNIGDEMQAIPSPAAINFVESIGQHDPFSSHSRVDMLYDSFPLELSQFDVIPGFDLGFDLSGNVYE
jgi:hypothetical protein